MYQSMFAVGEVNFQSCFCSIIYEVKISQKNKLAVWRVLATDHFCKYDREVYIYGMLCACSFIYMRKLEALNRPALHGF